MTSDNPPIAKIQPKVLSLHGDDRVDNYYWLNDPEKPETIAYLEAENAYTEAMTDHTSNFRKSLYEEMLARIQETDLSVPSRKDNYYYYSRTEQGKDYPIYCRKKDSLDAIEEVLIDQNKLAEGYEYFDVGTLEVSPNHQILAYSIDTSGSEEYTLFFLDLTTRTLYPEQISKTAPSQAWANDSQTVFYTQVDDTNRPYQIWRHILGQDPSQDELIYHEKDEAYFLGVGKTRSEAYIFLSLGSKITSEVHYLDANDPMGEFQIIHAREVGVEYDVEHHSDRFYIVTNDGAINFKLMETPVSHPAKENWKTVISHREDAMLLGVSAFTDHLVIYEQRGGLPAVQVRKLSTGTVTNLTFPEPTYSVWEGSNPEFNTSTLRFGYTSFITPSSVFEYDLDTHERILLKETSVLGGYDRTKYASEWLMATAQDGTQVPISIVYKKGTQKDGKNPLLLTGYGSYGSSSPAMFSSTRLSLLDRGFVFAIAHIRGGEEMGRKWYEEGKFLHKKNTFTDFIACAEYLIARGWTSSDRLAISGGSAGGLLMGAVVNLRSDLFSVVVADVPFVDVVTTMLDTSLPLTAIEWDEWGNPNDKTYYDYMLSYSPYDNVEAKEYPHLLVTAGLNDCRVKYWEPAKWTAKLRATKTDNNLLLLKTNMGAGHGGASGRYGQLEEIAFEYAFILDRLGIAVN
ncbi:MAG: S9 family peptidase [Geitlerinemataceae cyanobacterium]